MSTRSQPAIYKTYPARARIVHAVKFGRTPTPISVILQEAHHARI